MVIRDLSAVGGSRSSPRRIRRLRGAVSSSGGITALVTRMLWCALPVSMLLLPLSLELLPRFVITLTEGCWLVMLLAWSFGRRPTLHGDGDIRRVDARIEQEHRDMAQGRARVSPKVPRRC